MTLGQAVDYVRDTETQDWACACHGPPYCCIQGYFRAQAILRAGHIAVKQVAELAGMTS